jgi:hypothetical protein
MKFLERENEILSLIKAFVDAKIKFIVVGEYAVSGLGKHRFSVDCDMVIPKKNLEKFRRVLNERGYIKQIEKTGFDEVYGGDFVSYMKKVDGLPVTADMLIGSLASRQTDASWSFDYISKNSVEATINGIELSVTARILNRELLIAMKIHSGRKADIRDIIMLSREADWDLVKTHTKRGDIKRLKQRIEEIINVLNDKNLIPSIKGVFSLKQEVNRDIAYTKQMLQKILTSM